MLAPPPFSKGPNARNTREVGRAGRGAVGVEIAFFFHAVDVRGGVVSFFCLAVLQSSAATAL